MSLPTPTLNEYRSLSPNGDAQIVHMVPAASSQSPLVVHQAAGGSSSNESSTPPLHRRRTRPSPDQQQRQQQLLQQQQHRGNGGMDPVSQWRRTKIPSRHKNSNNNNPTYLVGSLRNIHLASQATDDDMDDATSFSSMRVVRDQDKPSRRKVSEWRNSVMQRKREQLALAQATGQWDALSPSSRTASLLDEVGNAAKTNPGCPSVSARILPFIPDVLPKSERSVAAGEEGPGPCYPFQRKDAKKRKEAAFTYFGTATSYNGVGFGGGVGSGNGGTKNENFDPTVMANSMAKSLAFLDLSQLSNCGKGKSASAAGGASSLSQTRAALLCSPMGLWGYPEARQDSNVMDTTILRAVEEEEEAPDEVEQQRQDQEGRISSRNGKYKMTKKVQQKSQVALEVIKLRKELKRLKHMVQTKRTKKEMRDAQEEQMRDRAAANAAPTTPTTATTSDSKHKNRHHVAAASTSSAGKSVTTSVVSSDKSVTTTAPHVATRLRFTEPLVTQVSYRPYTDPEDIEKLYFIEEELNELEWDRQTVADDQYEVIMAPSAKEVHIAHQKRRLLALHPQESLPHSLSDLSVY
eukprot:scaffold6899_cov183-Amphora_coffeaeformis.AAC.22